MILASGSISYIFWAIPPYTPQIELPRRCVESERCISIGEPAAVVRGRLSGDTSAQDVWLFGHAHTDAGMPVQQACHRGRTRLRCADQEEVGILFHGFEPSQEGEGGGFTAPVVPNSGQALGCSSKQ